VTDYVGDYLTRLWRGRGWVPDGCAGGDGAREAKGARAAFADGTGKLIDMLAAAQTGRPAERRAKAIRLLASLVGAVVIARAVGDDKLGGEVLEACRETAAAPRQRRRQA
jgi:TetR/AcrR family transcriptional repressor of nem operon